ncbi:sensor histidine kinase [Aromatoleum petrolei]|uniref:histidine kinase n=1 Tax=Aromatoleum petrolei TaxID=76116 RepID=A0ABX1MMP1_9RHOO|nr:sensor histidine kinase [Aromatoleum petrolei]NMF87931.1 HAMP domain-containing protein [Aromatoleum petrolei]QTQ36701.1 Two component system sensor histidine kinase [Aromatoleum petrolei]
MRASLSLRGRVARWLLPPLLILLAINAVLSWLGARQAVNRAYDRSLTASVRAIAEQVHSLEGEITVDVPYSAFEVFEAGVQERIFYAVFAPDGRLVTGYEDLRAPRVPAEDGALLIAEMPYRGEEVRIGAMKKRLYDPALAGSDAVTIVFAETTESRVALARELFFDSLRRQLLLVGLGALMLALALGTAFRPLVELRDAVQKRAEDDLTPVPTGNVPSEVQPLIGAINHHMERLSAMLVARRRFLTDAAHQIRTPLAVLSTQAEFGARQGDPGEMRRIFESILATIRSTRRMADQMLSLSRAEPANGLIQEQEPVELTDIAREVALELVPVALKKHIELAFEETGPAPMTGNAAMLRELAANLVDNAIRYSPPDTQVVVATGASDGRVVLAVSDEGPGIPLDERDKVFGRFYRILGQGGPDGSGLGLAIVREIALAHGGEVRLADAAGGHGLLVEVEFPRREAVAG